MSFSAFISFNGNCREAVTFYAEAFGLEQPKFLTYADAPSDAGMPAAPGVENLVMYTGLPIGGEIVMFCDVPPGMEYQLGSHISPVVGFEKEADMRRVFEGLKQGGTVEMELQKTFWSTLYGMVTDPFGITWQLNLDDGAAMYPGP